MTSATIARSRLERGLVSALIAASCVGCNAALDTSDDSGFPFEDAGVDAGQEPQVDSGIDAGTDAGLDAGVDSGVDSGVDAGLDAGRDAGTDAGFDAGADAGAVDGGRDGGTDAGVDAGVDGGSDAGRGAFGFTWTQSNQFITTAQKSKVVNLHLYGWGMLWPFLQDAPTGEADDGGLFASRLNAAVADGQEVMVTACCAPSTFASTGTAWDLDNARIADGGVALYASRVAALVSRYPAIKYVQVWNEFKGFWSSSKNRWDYENYTAFYDAVYAAVKAARPSVKVGGGYVAIRKRNSGHDALFNGVSVDQRDMDALNYWMTNAAGFDAVCVDGSFTPADYSKLTQYFHALPQAQGRPLYWSEFYVPLDGGTMSQAATQLGAAMRTGDLTLWWAETQFLPFSVPY